MTETAFIIDRLVCVDDRFVVVSFGGVDTLTLAHWQPNGHFRFIHYLIPV